MINVILMNQDDIGDKSVFMFNALPEEEKKALIQKLEMQTETDGWNQHSSFSTCTSKEVYAIDVHVW